jgi:hypothetical protein
MSSIYIYIYIYVCVYDISRLKVNSYGGKSSAFCSVLSVLVNFHGRNPCVKRGISLVSWLNKDINFLGLSSNQRFVSHWQLLYVIWPFSSFVFAVSQPRKGYFAKYCSFPVSCELRQRSGVWDPVTNQIQSCPRIHWFIIRGLPRPEKNWKITVICVS